MNEEIIQKLKQKEANLKDSIAKVRGLLELDRDKVRADEQMLYELGGRLIEVQQLMKELEEKK